MGLAALNIPVVIPEKAVLKMETKGFAFITMSAQSEADKAVSMFNTYSLSDHALKVSPAKPKE